MEINKINTKKYSINRSEKTHQKSIVYAKMNFEPTIFSCSNPFELLLDVLSAKVRTIFTTKRGNKVTGWVIIDNYKNTYDNQVYIFGKIGKIRQRLVRVFDEEKFSGKEDEIPKSFVSSYFLLSGFHNEAWLVFQEIEGDISVEQFCRAIAGICMQASHELGFISVYPDIEEVSYSNEFKKLKIIKRIQVDFVNPNPHFDHISDQFRELLLKEPHSVHASLDCEGPAKGLNLESSVVKLAELLPVETPQYGSVIVTGSESEEDASRVLSTYENAVKIKVELQENDIEAANALFRYLKIHMQNRNKRA